ncbi:MAG: hypothetical protein HYY44_07290 [Deltaproteobacteria bacterium]|nr:hypothetical protein [Deltaproteobacteria bacterium]
MKKKRKKLPSENEVASYWNHHAATDEADFSPGSRVEFVYQPPVKSISIRLPQPLLTELKRVAAKMDVAYQALIKMWLSEKVKEIRHS